MKVLQRVLQVVAIVIAGAFIVLCLICIWLVSGVSGIPPESEYADLCRTGQLLSSSGTPVADLYANIQGDCAEGTGRMEISVLSNGTIKKDWREVKIEIDDLPVKLGFLGKAWIGKLGWKVNINLPKNPKEFKVKTVFWTGSAWEQAFSPKIRLSYASVTPISLIALEDGSVEVKWSSQEGGEVRLFTSIPKENSWQALGLGRVAYPLETRGGIFYYTYLNTNTSVTPGPESYWVGKPCSCWQKLGGIASTRRFFGRGGGPLHPWRPWLP